MKRTGIAIAVVLAAAAIIVAIARSGDSPQHPTTNPPATHQKAEPCSTDQNPCIQLTAEDGTKYKLNDFRFLPGHCIAIISLPDNTSRKLCGNYKLDWIGPDTTKGIKGQSI